ncbi:hypothetical protein M0R45_006618 [Rubus argutus]|uniref:Uncharacterized protein n=1 Tax=Rubus argutus TaxID=59490 RepID=A0AAW1YRR6_RUBAR
MCLQVHGLLGGFTALAMNPRWVWGSGIGRGLCRLGLKFGYGLGRFVLEVGHGFVFDLGGGKGKGRVAWMKEVWLKRGRGTDLK